MVEFETSASPVIRLVPQRATFYGRGGTLFGIYLRNMLLSLLTLGIYYFWGKNRTRNYLVGQCEFDGDRFAWHGTGKELFLGTLKLLVVAVPFLIAVFVLPVLWKSVLAEALAQSAVAGVYFVLVPWAAVGARRYRMSRLSWRGIRFSFRGRWKDFFKLYVNGSLLMSLTLGLHYPYFQTKIRKFVAEHSYFGTMPFGFDGKGADLFGRFFLAIAGIITALGLAGAALFSAIQSASFFTHENLQTLIVIVMGMATPVVAALAVAAVAWFWFAAYRHRYLWNHTLFGPARFQSTMTAGKLFLQTFTNLLLLVLTLGLGFSWVTVRNAKFALANISLVGSLDLKSILQDAQAAGVSAESLADVLDLGFAGLDLPL